LLNFAQKYFLIFLRAAFTNISLRLIFPTLYSLPFSYLLALTKIMVLSTFEEEKFIYLDYFSYS